MRVHEYYLDEDCLPIDGPEAVKILGEFIIGETVDAIEEDPDHKHLVIIRFPNETGY